MSNVLIALEVVYAVSSLIQTSSNALTKLSGVIQKARSENRDITAEELQELMNDTDIKEARVFAKLEAAAKK